MILMKTDMDGANIAMPKKKKVKSRLIFCDKEYKKMCEIVLSKM